MALLSEQSRAAVEFVVALANAAEASENHVNWLRRLRSAAYKVSDRKTVNAVTNERWQQWADDATSWLWVAWDAKNKGLVESTKDKAKRAEYTRWLKGAKEEAERVKRQGGRRSALAVQQQEDAYAVFRSVRDADYMRRLARTTVLSRQLAQLSRQMAKLTLTLTGSANGVTTIALAPATLTAVAAWGASLLLDPAAACIDSGQPYQRFFGRCKWKACQRWFFRFPQSSKDNRGPAPSGCNRTHQNAAHQKVWRVREKERAGG